MAEPFDPFNNKRLFLYGTPWNKDEPRNTPKVSFHITNNSPRFRLYMNNGKQDKPIAFPMDPLVYSGLFDTLIEVAKNPDAEKVTWEIRSCFPHNGPRTEKPQPISRVMVGRDTDGTVYVAFQAVGEDLAKFSFRAPGFSSLIGADGERLDSKRASEISAIGWCKLLSSMMTTYLVTNAVDPDNGGGGGYGGGQRQTSNYGGGKPNGGGGKQFDDDVPY